MVEEEKEKLADTEYNPPPPPPPAAEDEIAEDQEEARSRPVLGDPSALTNVGQSAEEIVTQEAPPPLLPPPPAVIGDLSPNDDTAERTHPIAVFLGSSLDFFLNKFTPALLG